MANASTNPYCNFVNNLPANEANVHRKYHHEEYGFPIHSDDELFCRLILEINQAGLSWTTILKKQENFRAAYSQFNIKKVAAYTQVDIDRLLNDAGIIRNKLKVNAAIENAKTILLLQKEFGSFQKWLQHHHPKTKEEWTKLFKKTFRFTGGEIVNEFLMSCGFLKGAHSEDCPIYKKVIHSKPSWNTK
ncbi:MAG: DNA-3-methyladenine glycosylase I [Bacteroidetes bacterium]|nr:DNA-3-methyladenine glycosylase I [Bacteroidota bacterium]MBK9798363.1 DNA-3-methyladenine glycosylase I [Bacteroidota bacterium]MBP6414038.1 DNA-3-methyladenine glycosylase I [Bacteroidia bacterium]